MARTQPAPHWLEAEDLKIKTHRSPCLLCFIMFHINPKGTRYQWRSQCITGSVSQLLHEDWSTEQPNPTDFHDCSSNSIISSSLLQFTFHAHGARAHTREEWQQVKQSCSRSHGALLPVGSINGTLQPALAVSELCSQWLWKGTEHKVDRKRGVLTALHGLLGCSEEVLQSGLYRSAFLLLPCLPPGSSAPVCGCVCLFWVALLDQKKKAHVTLGRRWAVESILMFIYVCDRVNNINIIMRMMIWGSNSDVHTAHTEDSKKNESWKWDFTW